MAWAQDDGGGAKQKKFCGFKKDMPVVLKICWYTPTSFWQTLSISSSLACIAHIGVCEAAIFHSLRMSDQQE